VDEMIQRLRDAHAASTQGEWEIRYDYNVFGRHEVRGLRLVANTGGHTTNADNGEAEQANRNNAAFIIAAHNTLPALLDRLSAAEARVKELEGALDECRAFVACHAVSYSFQHQLSSDGQTWHPEHKAFFDRISGLSAAARAEKEKP
jgi:hypothetical protein